MKKQCIWLWHEPSNTMALADPGNGGLPLINLCDDIEMINPYYSYPISYLELLGWIVIGVL